MSALSVLAALLVSLFALTTVLARWFGAQRVERAAEHFRAGQRLAAAGRHADAVERFRSALLVARESGEYRLALARSLIELGLRSEGTLHLQEVLRQDPSAAVPNLLLGRVAATEGRTEQAATYYHRAIYGYWKLEPAQRRHETRWELISLFAKAGQVRQVVAEALELAADAPGDLDLQTAVADLLLEHGSPNQAREVLRAVVRERPADAEARTRLGQAELALGNYAGARVAFRRALAHDSRYLPARQGLERAEAVLSLDPTLRGVSRDERRRRSRELLSRSLAALDRCASDHLVPPETANIAAQARAELRRPGGDVEDNLRLAESVWQHRRDFCGPDYADEPVERVMARLSQ
jgi:tetratricopeptide (TPR) repeat protein